MDPLLSGLPDPFSRKQRKSAWKAICAFGAAVVVVIAVVSGINITNILGIAEGSADLLTVWEFHGTRQEINNARITPGQTFTTEWGLGQALPLKKDQSMLAQLGGVGYDQWQVSANSGVVSNPVAGPPLIPASLLPYYSVHAAGLQANFIVPKNGFSISFKSYWEFLAKARPQGATLVLGPAGRSGFLRQRKLLRKVATTSPHAA